MLCTRNNTDGNKFVIFFSGIALYYGDTYSLIPRPRPAFRRLQYGKAGRAWYPFLCEHDVIGKWQKFSEQTGCVSRIVQLTTCSTLGVYDNRPLLARYVW